MLALSLRFPGGRYHATPWGRHVNEGAVEWPPSPWRILRAFVATWKRALPELDAGTVTRALSILSEAPPEFLLPPASVAHTRHFLPDGNAVRSSAKGRDKVFDTFVAFCPRDPVVVVWPTAAIAAPVLAPLHRIARALRYLGRLESWSEAEIVVASAVSGATDDLRADAALARHVMAAPGRARSDDEDGTRVLVPEPFPPLPVIGCGHPLTIDTGTLREQARRLDPPGARWIPYRLPAEALAPRRRAAATPRVVRVARYALDARPLPRLVDAIAVAEAFRADVQRVFGIVARGAASPAFSGHGGDGKPLRGHRHARFLPTDEDGQGRVTHVTVVAADPFGEHEIAALERLDREPLRLRGGGEVRLLLLGLTDLADARERGVALLRKARTWVSVTPFVPARHPRRGHDEPVDQVRRELGLLGLPEPAEVVPQGRRRDVSPTYPTWNQFRRWRRSGVRPAVTNGFGFRIRFLEDVAGPIALGYGSHFGLGLFAPEPD